MPTRAERLDAILLKVAGKAVEYRDKNGGRWSPDRRGRAPYARETLSDGRIRLRVTKDDGDVISGIGATTDEALTMLEAKLS